MEIIVDNVTFAYSPEVVALKEVSLTVQPGETFSFAGRSQRANLTGRIAIFVNGCLHVKIDTSCYQPIGPGLMCGDFTVVEGTSVTTPQGPKIIKTGRLPIKPMTIDEAALGLAASKNEFFVFRDSVTDKVSVLYRRTDGHYGLIAPDF